MRRSVIALVLAAVLALAACSGDDDTTTADPATTTAPGVAGDDTTTTEPTTAPLRILVTNDDGVDAPGIDAIVEALRAEPDVEVVVVAPAHERSGTGGSTTDGPLTAVDATTASGYPAKAVDGFPADTVIWAVEQGNVERPDLVVSGINSGQNLGVVVDLSGTVGAARRAAAQGIPALALSAGLGEPPDYEASVAVAIEWFRANRDALAVGVVSINIPTCETGEVRGVVEVPLAPASDEERWHPLGPSDCASTLEDPVHDIDAFRNGYAAISDVPIAPAA